MLKQIQEADHIRFLATALSCLGDGVIAADREGKVLYINASGETLTGWSEKDAVGRSFEEVFPLVHYYSGEKLSNPIWDVLRQRKPLGLQNYAALVTKERNLHFVSASCSPIYSREDQAEGIVVVFRNIDRFKNTEEEIKKEKDNLKTVLEALPTDVMLVGYDWIIKWANKPLLDSFHIHGAEIVGQRFGDGLHCIHSYERGCGEGEQCRVCEICENIREVISKGVSRKDVVIQRSFAKETVESNRWLRMSFIPLSSLEEAQILIAIEDITEQKNHEDILRRSRDEAASANRIKGEFIANMSHEIRTPLNGLIGMMELLLRTDINPEQLEYIHMAKMSANNLLKVINDILDYSKIDAGKIQIKNIPFDMKTWMDEIADIHEALAEQKGLELRYDFSSDIPRYVVGDPDRLRQILNNLITNAIKFTDKGLVSIAVRSSAMAEQKNLLEFHISDTGIGISAEKMDLLFKRFSQIDGSITRRHSGTGLGLAICKQLAELMGGTISARSEPGKGSVFVLTIGLMTGSESAAKDIQHAVSEPDQALPLIVMEGGEYRRLIPNMPEGNTERIVIVENHTDTNLSSRVRLGDNGEIILEKAAAGGDVSHELDALFDLLRTLKAIIRDNCTSGIEEIAHKIKEIAFLLGADELADLAFKAKLSSRKGKWEDAMEYCVMMMNEINFRYKEG